MGEGGGKGRKKFLGRNDKKNGADIVADVCEDAAETRAEKA